MNSSLNATPMLEAMIRIFLSGAIGTRLPDHHAWISAYDTDLEMKLLLSFAKDPSLATTDTALEHIHYIYCQPSCNIQLYEDNDILFVKDLFNNDDKYFIARRSSSLARHYICGISFKPYR